MTGSKSEFEQLVAGVKNGSDAAIREFCTRYEQHIFRAVRRRLKQPLRTKFDSEDFVQTVWASFFANRSKISEFKQPDDLVHFLIRIATNKVIDECRRRLTLKKYNVNCEHSMDGSAEWAKEWATTREPSPSEVATAHEQWHRLVDGQTPRDRRVAELCAAGATHGEIAETLNVSERTVRRVLRRLSKRHTEQ